MDFNNCTALGIPAWRNPLIAKSGLLLIFSTKDINQLALIDLLTLIPQSIFTLFKDMSVLSFWCISLACQV